MTRQTQLHNWKVPTEGDNNYEETFDNWFTAVDESVEIRDVRSNLGNYEPINNQKFYAIDTEEVFIGDGTQWVKKETSGENPTFQDVTADSLNADSIGNNGSDINLVDDLLVSDDYVIKGDGKRQLIDPESETINDTERVRLTDETPRLMGLVIVADSDGNVSALVLLQTLSATIVSDPGNAFSTTKGNEGKTNIYHDSNDNTMYIENQKGESRTYQWTIIGGGS
jgi:hypothetical protein